MKEDLKIIALIIPIMLSVFSVRQWSLLFLSSWRLPDYMQKKAKTGLTLPELIFSSCQFDGVVLKDCMNSECEFKNCKDIFARDTASMV